MICPKVLPGNEEQSTSKSIESVLGKQVLTSLGLHEDAVRRKSARYHVDTKHNVDANVHPEKHYISPLLWIDLSEHSMVLSLSASSHYYLTCGGPPHQCGTCRLQESSVLARRSPIPPAVAASLLVTLRQTCHSAGLSET